MLLITSQKLERLLSFIVFNKQLQVDSNVTQSGSFGHQCTESQSSGLRHYLYLVTN